MIQVQVNFFSEGRYVMTVTAADFMQEARQIAAQCWCDKETEGITLDPRLCTAVAQRIANWMETAARESGNRDYYRGLCLQCVETLSGAQKERMFRTDDGEISADPLLDRLPEVINEMSARYHSNDEILAELHVMFDRALIREIPAKVEGLFRERDSYKMVAEDLSGFMRECGAKMGIQGVIHNDEVKDNIVKAIAHYLRPVKTGQSTATIEEVTRLNEFIQTVAERFGISKEERFDTGREVQLRILSNLDALRHIQDEWTKDCELIGEIHKAAGFRPGQLAEELPDEMRKLVAIRNDVAGFGRKCSKAMGGILDEENWRQQLLDYLHDRHSAADRTALDAITISEAAKVREYEEHFSQCIRILGLKPGVDVPLAIKRALAISLQQTAGPGPLPTAAENPGGLHQRYIVLKADGSPVDPEAVYFVLRLDVDQTGQSENRIASRYAALAYAYMVKRNGNLKLKEVADDLIDMIGVDLKFFERMISTSVLSFIARDLTFEVGCVEDRTDLMTRANAWHVLMNTIGI